MKCEIEFCVMLWNEKVKFGIAQCHTQIQKNIRRIELKKPLPFLCQRQNLHLQDHNNHHGEIDQTRRIHGQEEHRVGQELGKESIPQ